MTIIRRDGMPKSAFEDWTRTVPGLDSKEYQLSITDNDCWVHQFAKRKENSAGIQQVIENLMLVEVKTFGAQQPFAQRDTLDVINRILRKSSVRPNGRRYAVKIADSRHPGCHRYVRWFGVHLLQLSSDRPDKSVEIIWNKLWISEQGLIEILRFERDPDHPAKALDTRRHHRRPFRETQPQLKLVLEGPP